MPAYDQSFSAEGPTLVGFETVGLNPSDVPEFGVAVFAHQCGVNGIAVSDVPANAYRVAPELVGVHGLGENEGVQGEGPIGVHGIARVSGSPGEQGIGVQGNGGHIGVLGKGDIGVRGEAPQTGVEGRGATGMLGMGETGVKGSGESAGVLGFSKHSRGGVFLAGLDELPALNRFGAKASAQVLLVPVKVKGPVEGHLPRTGLAGDLLAIVRTDTNQASAAELWFCIRNGSADSAEPGAAWARVQFETTVTVL